MWDLFGLRSIVHHLLPKSKLNYSMNAAGTVPRLFSLIITSKFPHRIERKNVRKKQGAGERTLLINQKEETDKTS